MDALRPIKKAPDSARGFFVGGASSTGFEAGDPGIGGETVQDDAQYDGAEHGGDDGALAEEGRLILQHHHRKDDASQPRGPNQPMKSLSSSLRPVPNRLSQTGSMRSRVRLAAA